MKHQLGTAALIIFLVISICHTNQRVVIVLSGSGGEIDLFSDKQPHGGIGQNVPSDAFSFGEEVRVNARVAYNDFPVRSVLVAFGIEGTMNYKLYRTAITNESGLATISFRIPFSNETTTGEWRIVGNVIIGDSVFTDIITFRAGWIVQILSIDTLNENNVSSDKFAIGNTMGICVGLRSIAMTEKTAMLTVTAYDSLNVAMDSASINEFRVPPNETLIHAYFVLSIPQNASVGEAIVTADAYTKPLSSGGVSYCPEVSKGFIIVSHDIAILNVIPYPMLVYIGDSVNIDVTAANIGSEAESFNIIVYGNQTVIATRMIIEMKSSSAEIIRFTWNTEQSTYGFYLISAFATPVVGETDISDNTYRDSYVEIRPKPQTSIHDIAISDLFPQNNSVYTGDFVDVYIVAANLGNFTESFTVTLFYDDTVAGDMIVADLGASETQTLVFHWDTSGIDPDTYILKASASQVAGEINVENNVHVDGRIEVKARIPPSLLHDVAVLSVVPSSSTVYVGGFLDVNVVAKNNGYLSESFNVILYYDGTVAGIMRVTNLTAGNSYTVAFRWNTAGVPVGNYTLRAYAEPVQGEVNIADNTFTDGTVQVIQAPASFFASDWFTFFAIALIILLIVLLLAWLLLRRRKKDSDAFSAGWTAWYYSYEPKHRSVTRKNVQRRSVNRRVR